MVSIMKCIISAPIACLVEPGDVERAHRPAGLGERLAARRATAPPPDRRWCGRPSRRGRQPRRAPDRCGCRCRPSAARSTVIRCSRGPSMNSCSWLCWSSGPRQAIGVVPSPFLPRLSAHSCTNQRREAAEPVGIGHHHLHADAALAAPARRPAPRRAPARQAIGSGRGSMPSTTSSRRRARIARDIEAARHRRQQADVGQRREAAADAGVMIEQRNADAPRTAARRPLLAAGAAGSVDAEEQLRDASLRARRPDHRVERRHAPAPASPACRPTSR